MDNSKTPATFGYPSSVYKATSKHDGHTYALRRIAGFRLNSEDQIRTINTWKRVNNSSLVTVHDAFTGRWFGDSSLIIVTEYHPCSQTLADKAFGSQREARKHVSQVAPEGELWGYIVQLTSALRTIHAAGQAAQTVIASKVLLTSKNRVRLSGCAILDIIQYDRRPSMFELQNADLRDLGRLILSIATRNQLAHKDPQKALDLISRSYTERLRSCVAWLLAPPQEGDGNDYSANALLTSIADKVSNESVSLISQLSNSRAQRQTLQFRRDLLTYLP